MEIIIIIVFILGYLGITLEHNLKLDKLIPALIMMSICWAIIALGVDSFSNWFDSSKHGLVDGFSSMLHADKMHLVEETLLHHLGKTAEILVFLLGAMTIVEIIDYFDGFSTIKGYVNFKSKKKLLWMFAILAFILSAIIDNLTATIVLISILQKIVKKRDDRIWFAGLIIICCKCRWCLVSNWRCNYHHVVDCKQGKCRNVIYLFNHTLIIVYASAYLNSIFFASFSRRYS